MASESTKTALIVPLTDTSAEAMRAGMAAAAEAGADMVECRLDRLASCDGAALRTLLTDRPLPTIVTYRPVRQGGLYDGDERRRLAVLAEAAELGADYVDVEDDVDRSQWPKARIILSHHDFARRPADLDAIVRRLMTSDAAVAKVAFASAGPEDALAALAVLTSAAKPAIALAMGEHGAMSRILARKFGAFGTFASADAGAESAPGQLTLDEMRQTYRWDALGPATAVYGVIGCPIAHSMSPAIHNAAFAAEGIDAVYVPLRIELGPAGFRRFFDAVDASPWSHLKGFSVTIPHKENAIARVGPARVDELSRRIGAVNTLRIDGDGSLSGWNTDYAAAIDALVESMGIGRENLAGRPVAVLGAGGAARAIVAALAHYGADVTIYNRTLERGRRLAAEFGAQAEPIESVTALSAEILVNCTSVGMHPLVNEMPIPADVLKRVVVVFDTVYNPIETRLLREAAKAGCLCVSGVDMFVNQAVAQFEIWTGRRAPRELMRSVVVDRLNS